MKPTSRRPIVLITGAAGGLGTSMVATFAAAGWQVIAGWHRRPVHPDTCAVEALHSIPLDVTDPESVAAAFSGLRNRFGRLDALINAAGVTVDRSMVTLEPVDWDRVIGVNLRGTVRCTLAALPFFPSDAGGHIVNVGSLAGRVGRIGQANYAAAKAGLVGFSKSLAREMGSRNVRVNVVLPGVMATPMTAALSPEQLRRLQSENTLGRLNDPAEISRFILFLTGTQTISGQVFNLDSRIYP